MNYYPFHIGDYISHTRHLSDAEDLAYRRMIDLYYQSEQPFKDSESVARKVNSTPEIISVLLSEYFVKSEDGWRNKRADEEIAKYHAKADSARNANKAKLAKKSELKSELKSEPIQNATNNQEPITNNHIKDKALKIACPSDVNEQVWNDWLQLRKIKKASVTKTVLDGARKEANKAELSLEDFLKIWCLRGSQGLEASWLKPEEKKIFRTQADKTRDVLSGLTRGLIGGNNDIKLL